MKNGKKTLKIKIALLYQWSYAGLMIEKKLKRKKHEKYKKLRFLKRKEEKKFKNSKKKVYGKIFNNSTIWRGRTHE